MKKTISVLLCVLMLASLLTSCSDGGSSVSSNGPTSPAGDTSSVNTSTATDGETPSWKQDSAPITLEWFVAYDWAAHTFDPVNNVTDKYINQETGVTIKWSYGDLEKLNMLITTNSLPDIVTYDIISNERLTMENNGLLQPLDDLRDQYAPDMNVPQEMIEWYRNDNDNHWYAFASYYADTSVEGYKYLTNNMNYARMDIMEQLDITAEDMQTKDGFVNALKKVKEAKIMYNGVLVEPFIGENITFLAEQFGVDREDADGNLINIMRQQEYLEALLFMNRLYNEGLMSDEVFTMDTALRRQMIASGAVFAGMDYTYLEEGLKDLFYSDNNALLKHVGHIKGDAGKEPILSPSATGGWTGTMISKNCKAPERAISLFALMTQEHMNLAQVYGGVGGYDIIDGIATIKPEIAAERDTDSATFTEKYITDATYMCDWNVITKYEPHENLDAYQQDNLEQGEYYKDMCYNDKPFYNVVPEGGTDLAARQAQNDQYWEQQYPQIVMATTSEKATELYNQTLQQMDAMGMAELDAYKNEKFQKNKEKLGLDLAWSRNQK